MVGANLALVGLVFGQLVSNQIHSASYYNTFVDLPVGWDLPMGMVGISTSE